MPVLNVPVYMDSEGANVYTIYVTAMGMSGRYLDTADQNNENYYRCMKECKRVLASGFCLATSEQVRALDVYISHYRLRHVDLMAYPDRVARPPAIRNIRVGVHEYDVGTVMNTPDFASFYIRRSHAGTPRLVHVSKTAVTRAVPFQ